MGRIPSPLSRAPCWFRQVARRPTRLVGIGEALERLGAKYVLLVCGDEAKETCGVDQLLCAGLEAGIEGGILAAKLLWQEHMPMQRNRDSCWLMQRMHSTKAAGY